MNVLLIVINVLLILVALILIVCVLMQEGNRAGLGAIGGGAETFFGKSKAKGVQGKLQLITKIGAAVFIVLAITATALTARLNVDQANAPVPEIPAADVTAQPDASAEPTEGTLPEATEVPAEAPAASPAEAPAA